MSSANGSIFLKYPFQPDFILTPPTPPSNLRYVWFTLLSYHQYATTLHCIQF
jgi:hypothetical protein